MKPEVMPARRSAFRTWLLEGLAIAATGGALGGVLSECDRERPAPALQAPVETPVETLEMVTCDGPVSGILSSGDLVSRYGCP